MPGIATGISRFPSFGFLPIPSSPHLCLHQAGSLHLTRKDHCFEALPVSIPWRDKMAFKFTVDGRW
jgi:hypothetical protein